MISFSVLKYLELWRNEFYWLTSKLRKVDHQWFFKTTLLWLLSPQCCIRFKADSQTIS